MKFNSQRKREHGKPWFWVEKRTRYLIVNGAIPWSAAALNANYTCNADQSTNSPFKREIVLKLAHLLGPLEQTTNSCSLNQKYNDYTFSGDFAGIKVKRDIFCKTPFLERHTKWKSPVLIFLTFRNLYLPCNKIYEDEAKQKTNNWYIRFVFCHDKIIQFEGGVRGVRKPENRTEIRQKTVNGTGFFPEYRNRAYM